jgi:hypothetical protein
MTKRRDHGDGSIDARGENSWRLRYRISGKRFTKTFRGSLSDARKELRRLIHSGDSGDHVAPDKMTLGQWIKHWLAIGAPGKRRRREVGARSLERYSEMLCLHVVPMLGERPLQQLQSTEIDALYERLGDKLSGKTLCDLHGILGACVATAYRTRKLPRDPMLELAKVPSPGEINHGTVLEEDQLRVLIQGFKGSPLFLIVATAQPSTSTASRAMASLPISLSCRSSRPGSCRWESSAFSPCPSGEYPRVFNQMSGRWGRTDR